MKASKNKFRLSTVFTCMALSGGLGNLAMAQEASDKAEKDTEVIQIVARGYADSLALALNAKRNAAGAVDAILAEDIADFPDQNLADSLQRIPGITINRDGGEGRSVVVRGLNSTFTSITLNGMQTQSLSGGSTGITTNRSFDFNVFASELFNSLEAHKTSSAKLEEGSLGATVMLNTGRPFNFKDDVLAFNYSQSYNAQSEESTPRASGVYSVTNEEDTVGALFSFAYSDRNINNAGVNSGRWRKTSNFEDCVPCAGDTAEARAATLSDTFHPRFPRMADKTQDQQRTGLTAAFQFVPSESTLVTVDALYSNIDAQRLEPFMQAISMARTGGTGNQQSTITALQIDDNNTMYAGTVDNVDVRSEYFESNWETDFTQFSVNIEHEFNDDFSMSALVGSSKSDLTSRENTVALEHFSPNDSRKLISYAQDVSSVTYDYTNVLNPLIEYGFDTTNPQNWEMSEFRDRVMDAESKASTAKADFAYVLNDNITINAGISQKEYTFDLTAARYDALFSSRVGDDGTACGIESAVSETNGSVVSFGGQSMFMANSSEIARLQDSGCWNVPNLRTGDNRSVEEDSLGYYIQADFEADIGDMYLRGNAGVRKVTTDLAASGLVNGEWTTVEHDYSDTLPAINLALEATENLLFRASWAEVMTRPGLSNLNPGGSVDAFTLTVSQGNPFLSPFAADALDFSVEWYFDEGALLSFAYFQKDIGSFIESVTETVNWQDLGLPDSLLGAQAGDARTAEFQVRRSTNGQGGDLDGYEIQYQQQLKFLPGPDWVQNFGVLANMTFVDSEVTRSNGDKGPLIGQSDTSSNFTLYWEDDVFSARVSMAKRDSYLQTWNATSTEQRYFDPVTFVDASASYKITENLTVKFDAINLTDEVIFQYMDPAAKRVIDSVQTGRQYSIGLSYKM